VTASSTLSPSHDAQYAFDGKELSAWAAQTSAASSLEVRLSRAAPLKSIDFLARGTCLYESWQAVTVRLYRGKELLLEENFSFPDAAARRLERAEFSPTVADRVELLFSQPVDQTPWGQKVDLQILHPGYAEITLGET